MTINQFIYSSNLKWRACRHFAFWVWYYLYTVINSLPGLSLQAIKDPGLYSSSLFDAVEYLPVFLLSVYSSLYFILPRYLKNKNLSFLIVSVAVLNGISFLTGYFISEIVFKKAGFSTLGLVTVTIQECIGKQITISVLAVILKVMKDYSLKQRKNELLAIENIGSKLQLFKMQLHPQIIFESLHIIYSNADNNTKNASEMILKLSDLLNYILYDSKLEYIELDKEISMIRNYSELKKSAYKNEINIFFEINSNAYAHYITPGLLLSLLEMTIMPVEEPEKNIVVTIEVKIVSARLYFTIQNNTSGNIIIALPAAKEILNNSKKALEAFHSHNFKLEIQATAESFMIYLELELISRESTNGHKIESMVYEHT